MAEDTHASKGLVSEALLQKLAIDEKPEKVETSERNPLESGAGPSGGPVEVEKLLAEADRSKSVQGGLKGVDIKSESGSEFQKVFGGKPWVQIDQKSESFPTSVNYIKLDVEKNRNVFEYKVQFVPPVDVMCYRFKLVDQALGQFSTTKIYDGDDCLYLPSRYITDKQEFADVIPNTNDQVKIVINYKQKMEMKECYHLYNMLFANMRHIFNPDHKKLDILQQLEIFPGDVMAINEVEDGLILTCRDLEPRSHSKRTAYQLLQEYKATNPEDFKQVAMRNIAGTICLNAHNKKTYKIEGFAWDKTPRDTFMDHENVPITFIDYYKRRYNIDIQDHDQPLLTSKVTTVVDGVMQETLIHLVPELSFISGLTIRDDILAAEDDGSFRSTIKSQTVYELLQEYQAANPNNFQETAMKNIIGSMVFTRYDNRCHLIQNIVWNLTPKLKILHILRNLPINYIDYFKLAYNIDIQDEDQPLLLSKMTTMTDAGPQEIWIYLVPELSYLTGISIRTDFEIQEDPSTTSITYNQRMLALRTYFEKVRSSEEAQKALAVWGLKMVDVTREIKTFFGESRNLGRLD